MSEYKVPAGDWEGDSTIYLICVYGGSSLFSSSNHLWLAKICLQNRQTAGSKGEQRRYPQYYMGKQLLKVSKPTSNPIGPNLSTSCNVLASQGYCQLEWSLLSQIDCRITFYPWLYNSHTWGVSKNLSEIWSTKVMTHHKEITWVYVSAAPSNVHKPHISYFVLVLSFAAHTIGNYAVILLLPFSFQVQELIEKGFLTGTRIFFLQY